MNYLLIESASKFYGDKCLFNDLNLGINKGQKIALIARNGTGKTSLLNTIAGIDLPDSGSVKLNKNLTIGYLRQEPIFDTESTIIASIFSQETPVMNIIRAYEMATRADASESEKASIPNLMHEMDRLQAWDQEARVKQVLSKLNITEFNSKIKTLSGGQKKRLALANILIKDPQFLILDEPTNHLDIQMIEWLENYLQQPNLTLILVTHDRYFLDRITNEIIELDNGQLYNYKGNYQYFLEKKTERLAAENTEVSKAQNLLRKELEWMRRMPKARGTKSKARIDSFYNLKATAGKNTSAENIPFAVSSSRLGSKILEMRSVCKSYGTLNLIDKFSYSFKRGEKIGITGRNGTGKTTLLNLITGKLKPDSGTIKTGQTVEFGYFRQEDTLFDSSRRIIDIMRDIAEVVTMDDGHAISVAQFLRRFGYNNDMHFAQYGTLSGGERRRLHLLTVLMRNPNFLILDEPTNDLDLDTLQSLEAFLVGFQGCLIVVSHDRFFMDKMVDHLFVFKGDGSITDFPGNYSQYRQQKTVASGNRKVERKQTKQAKSQRPMRTKTRLSYKEGLEFDRLEAEIEMLEKQKAELTENMQSGSHDYEKLMEWSAELEKIEPLLEAKSERWLELSEFER